ncbi:sigma-70 family RNA polymerase sigma factor [Hylemonella sp. W303a]|uniref:sigma-70 family RNA polymerase sigma factor n=1 Tax=Hylemonella sp. W303a TaxID=3389873 RepID=UPI00396B269F
MPDERLSDLPAPPDFLHANRRHLVRAATRLLGPAEAEDAVHDAYVRALEARELKLNVAQAWLLTVMRHIAIDRLRRRQWMQQWLTETTDASPPRTETSAEADVALWQESTRALRLLATQLAAVDGAMVLLHEVFEADHAEMAQALGKTEASSRQQLRRALLRLRRAGDAPPQATEREARPGTAQEQATKQETLFRVYLQALRLRDPQTLWALLRQPPVSASATTGAMAPQAGTRTHPATLGATSTPRTHISSLMQVGGQLGLLLTLDGVTLCVLPLGARAEQASQDFAF